MTPEEMNIAIAELLGWTEIHYPSFGIPPMGDTPKRIPNFARDLNAMHYVLVSRVPDNQWDDFMEILVEITPLGLRPSQKRKAAFTASAEMLTEAFLKFVYPELQEIA